MSYYIVNCETGAMFKKFSWASATVYDTMRGANIVCTKLNKKITDPSATRWQVMEINRWNEFKNMKWPVQMVKRINLMSGQEYYEPEDTPNYCSPSCESYWSM